MLQDRPQSERAEELLEHAVDRFGAQCEAQWLAARGLQNYTSQFLEHGYHAMEIPEEIAAAMKGCFSEDIAMPIGSVPDRTDYVHAKIAPAVAVQLNERNTYFGTPDASVIKAFETYFDSIRDEVETQLGHCWQVTNVRAWSVNPGSDYGANIWHTDGFSRYVRKFLIYVNPPGVEAGTTEITTRKNEVMHVEAKTPLCVLYDSDVLSHRGRSPRSDVRPIIEVTIAPAEKTSTKCVFAGQLARVPLNIASAVQSELGPLRYSSETDRRSGKLSLRKMVKSVGQSISGARKAFRKTTAGSKSERKLPAVTNLSGRLNLGGGRKWQHKGWINLEGVGGPANPYPIWFSDSVVFPVPSSTIQLAYSSHCLEHLDDGTVERMLRETRRTLSRDGVLVLKLPDFEEVIKRWRAGDEAFFRNEWRFGKVSHTWGAKGVDADINARAAYIFCGFWNEAFGEHFDGAANRKAANEAYNGPPVQIADMADDLLKIDSPHEIAEHLRRCVVETETGFAFNHQNAWSRKEMQALLEACGFRVDSFDAPEIMRRHADIPGIELMEEISFYCRAVPV